MNLGNGITSAVIYNTAQNPVPTDTAKTNKPFTYQEGAASMTGTTYSRQSLAPYFTADCRETASSTDCAPAWTYTIQYSTFGPDQFRKTDSDITLDVSDNLCFKPQGPPTNNPNNPCKNKKYQNQPADLIITDTFDSTSTAEIQEGQNAGYPLGQACLLNDPNCRCAGDTCVGAYKLYLRVIPTNDFYQTWWFKASGPGLGTEEDPLIFSVTPVEQTIVFPNGLSKRGWFGEPNEESARQKLSNIPSFGGQWRFEVAGFPPSPDGGKSIWVLDSIDGQSSLYGKLTSDGGTVTSESYTFWNEPSGCNKVGTDVFALQGQDLLWTVWHGQLKAPALNGCN
ncbi:MAG: hypothetical protein HP491_19400 [Nitrospira sp.]|nr:hypothetical protein [Nitrospira sp.]MBH0183293.1 hypothetical protein [Nitrospira sp.]